MENTFIKYVANDILEKYGTNLSDITVVFPNKRAALFLNQAFADISDKPIWSPSYITINELLHSMSDYVIPDEIKLICELYHSYVEITKSNETLDEFYGWGQLLLSDFDDIDKNMADARMIFNNVANLHEFDSIDYLSDEQKETLKQFFSQFTDDHNSKLRERFLRLWNCLYDVYVDFNNRLNKQNLTYEGALYREVVNKKDMKLKNKLYLFVGFNLLQKSEKMLFSRLQHDDCAKFYWDFDYYYCNSQHEAGRFINQNMQSFTNELDSNDDNIYSNFNAPKNITYISSPTENAQGRYVAQWLTDERIDAGRKTAIVLCNEGLLQTITHCLPDKAKEINITSGYPLNQTPIASFISLLIKLQTVGKVKNTDKYRLKHVNNILRHSYISLVSEDAKQLYDDLNTKKRYFPNKAELCENELLSILFGDIDTDNYNLSMTEWLIKIVEKIATRGKEMLPDDAFFQESVFRTYTLLNRLYTLIADNDLVVDNNTYQRLLQQIISSTSIPFHGEPIKGVQIMGVLETRNLDFEHLLILSCNEGKLPKSLHDNSFIPYSVKKSFELTTIDNKVAIYAYYFYRLIQRAKDITIIYNNSTESGHMNEMSRFMLQMMVESNHDITRKNIKTELSPVSSTNREIAKDDTVVSKLNSLKRIYPTDINCYLRCQKRFFYSKLARIRELDEYDEDSIDNRMFGNIFHYAAEILYNSIKSENGTIEKQQIEYLIKHKERIVMAVDCAFKRELFKLNENDKQIPEYNGLQLINREVITNYLVQLLRNDLKLAPFCIIGLEKEVWKDYSFDSAKGEKINLSLCGKIDRLDMISTPDDGNRIRVIDYKTGHSVPERINSVEDVFVDNNIEKHSDYFLQTMLYASIVRNSEKYNANDLPVSPALLFIQRSSSSNYDPTLKFGKDEIKDIKEYEDEFMTYIDNTIADIFDKDKPFKPTSKPSRCMICPYFDICKI